MSTRIGLRIHDCKSHMHGYHILEIFKLNPESTVFELDIHKFAEILTVYSVFPEFYS